MHKTNQTKDKDYREIPNKNKDHIVIPYTQRLCESIKTICKKCAIQTHYKGGRTLKNILVTPNAEKASNKRVNEYIDTDATGWNVIMSTPGSQPEPLGKVQGTPEGTFAHIWPSIQNMPQ